MEVGIGEEGSRMVEIVGEGAGGAVSAGLAALGVVRITDPGNNLMGVEVLFAFDLAPGDRVGRWGAPLHIFIFNLLHGTGVTHVVAAVHHARTSPIAHPRAIMNIRLFIGVSSLGPIVVIDVGEVIIIARVHPYRVVTITDRFDEVAAAIKGLDH